jgi:outer membrane receptor protein involved in Fe transport
MIDGIQSNDPTNSRGGSVNLSHLTPEHIEQIENLRGPASSLYGSDPMAGAINIITRRGGNEPKYSFMAEGGSFNYGRGVIQSSGPLKPFNYSFSLGFNRNDEQVKKDKSNLPRSLRLAKRDTAPDNSIYKNRKPSISRRQRRPTPGDLTRGRRERRRRFRRRT